MCVVYIYIYIYVITIYIYIYIYFVNSLSEPGRGCRSKTRDLDDRTSVALPLLMLLTATNCY